ncbi:MAG: DHH family phosphoesterase [Bacteroidales bacterium]|nr:DHH family phosphoesterase [Bacteroidales bacterium]
MLTIDNQQITILRSWVEEASDVVVIAHRNADGDAVGSSLAIWHILRSMGKNVFVVLPDGCPYTYSWLPGSESIRGGERQQDECRGLLLSADLIIAVDFNAPYRVAALQEALSEARCRKVLIDHHENPAKEAFNLLFSRPEISSACELCYWVALSAWGPDAIDRTVATCLYTGIRTDTGGLSYSCNQPSLYEAVAALVARDIDPERLNHFIVDNYSVDRLMFYAFAISQRLKIFPEHKFAYFYISLDDQHRHHIDSVDIEGLVNYTLRLQQVEVGALIREEPKRIKVSLRSKFDFNVERIASQFFNGGGHIKAAGGDCVGMTMKEVMDKVENVFLSQTR